MEHKRDGWVSIGEASTGPVGPVKKPLRADAPQALHHYTRFDQVNQLVGASEADPDLGFMARMLALCSLPRTNPGNQSKYVRRNGPFTLVMIAGGLHKLPFGNLPACCWPGLQRKPSRRASAISCWAVRSPGSCESSA